MRRIRRKRKFTWLPVLGIAPLTGVGTGRPCFNKFILDVPVNGTPVVGAVPLTFDQGLDEANLLDLPTNLINDLLGEEYFLKRIVGKCFLNRLIPAGMANLSTYSRVFVTAGFCVADRDETFPTFPNNFLSEPSLYNPQLQLTAREPWIWRRSWILGSGNLEHTDGTIVQGEVWPATNTQEPSSFDGPHIDAKTARRIRSRERLWFITAAQNIEAEVNGVITHVSVLLDYRLLGALRRTRNRGSF